MKRISILLFCLLLLACVPTPDEEVVFGDAQTGRTDTPQALDICPDAVHEVILDEPHNRVVIDAKVTASAAAPFREIAYEKNFFSDRELNAFLTLLIGDAPVYSYPERTKDVIKAEMEDCVRTMEQTDPDSDDYRSAQEEIKDLQDEYQDAPEGSPSRELIERKLSEIGGMSMFHAITELDGHTFELYCSKNLLSLRDPERTYPRYDFHFETVPPSSLDQNQAEETAIALVEKLAPQLALCKTDHRWNETATAESYCMTFRPAVNGTAAADRHVLGRDDSMLVANDWHADTLTVEIDAEGVSQVTWHDPGKAQDLPRTDVSLLPFDRILSNAKQQLKNQYAWRDCEDAVPVDIEVYVDRIVLEYAVVMWRDHGDVMKLIPVWNFYGGERVQTPEFGTVEQYGFRTDIVHVSVDASTGKILPN